VEFAFDPAAVSLAPNASANVTVTLTQSQPVAQNETQPSGIFVLDEDHHGYADHLDLTLRLTPPPGSASPTDQAGGSAGDAGAATAATSTTPASDERQAPPAALPLLLGGIAAAALVRRRRA
jgi:hypothetical protein